MTRLLLETSFPSSVTDEKLIAEQIETTGKMPVEESAEAQDNAKLCYVLYLVRNEERTLALDFINSVLESERHQLMPPLHHAWLRLARMTLLIDIEDFSAALNEAENTLVILSGMIGRKNDTFLAIVASILFNLSRLHHATGESGRATKELLKSQQLFERLAKKDEAKYSAMLFHAVKASTSIIKSRQRQMQIFAHYQDITEQNTLLLNDDSDATIALGNLVDSLAHEGEIMLELGNGRNAVKYYTRALRYQKRLSDGMGMRELELSLGLARGLMRVTNRRAAAEQLLSSLLPLSQRLGAQKEESEITDLLNSKNKNFNIMNLLKTIFTCVVLTLCAATSADAQLIVGHRGSVWGVENTKAAFVNGARAGAWGLECDIHLTADGAFVVCHDATTKRIGGTEERLGSINLNRAMAIELSQTRRGIYYAGHLISLGEYLDICKEENVVPVIEVKYTDCATVHSEEKNPENNNFTGVPALLSLVESKGLLDKAVIISFMPGVIEYIKTNHPNVQVQVLAGDGDINNWVTWCKERKIDLDASWGLITKEAVDELHKAGLKVNVWTVDDPEVFARLQEWGVDYITTNALFPQKSN